MYDDIVNKINKGNYVEAEIICKDLIKKNKTNSDYFYLLGFLKPHKQLFFLIHFKLLVL